MIQVDGIDNIINLLYQVDYRWVLAGVVCLLIHWACEAINLHIPLKKMYPNQNIKNSIKVSMIGLLFNNITPFASGGQPMQAYELTKTGKRVSDSLSAMAIKFIITQIALVVTTIVVIFFEFDFFKNLMQNYLWVAIVGFLINILAIVIVILVGIKKSIISSITTPIIKFLGKIHILKHPIEILEKLPQDKYELLSSKNKKCYCRLHSQWNLKGTKTEAYYDMNTDFTLGICLDIFVLDNIPNDGLRKKIFSIKQTLIRKLIWSYEITNSEAYISKNKERMGKILKIIFKIFRINFTKIKKINNNFIEKYRNENCENVCNLSTTYELVSIPKNIFCPPKKVKFEDVEVNIPKDYDKYLKIIYGDNYMEIPPKEDRYNHIYNTVDFGPYE